MKVKKIYRIIRSEDKVLRISQDILNKFNLQDYVEINILDHAKMFNPAYFAQCAYQARNNHRFCVISFSRKCFKRKIKMSENMIRETIIHEICHALQYLRGDFDNKTVEQCRETDHNKEFHLEFYRLLYKFSNAKSVKHHYTKVKFAKAKSIGWRKQIKYIPTITELRKEGIYGNQGLTNN